MVVCVGAEEGEQRAWIAVGLDEEEKGVGSMEGGGEGGDGGGVLGTGGGGGGEEGEQDMARSGVRVVRGGRDVARGEERAGRGGREM